MGETYYYHQLNKQQQAVYYAILKGVQSLEEEFVIPRCESEELYNILFRMRLDHPEIFWATGFRYKYYNDSPNLIFVPEYLFKKNKIIEHQKAMTARVKKLVQPAMKLSEWEKEKYVHDFICENVYYDKLKKPYSHEIIGPLGQGVGVCEGIAKAVKVLMDALGVWCVIALCGNNPEKGIKYRHTWNIVKIGGTYYHLDATFDNTLSNGDGQSEKKGKTLTFQWRGGFLTREVMGELLELIRKAGQEKDKTARIQLNWPQAVVRISYQDAGLQETVLMEDANISEQ